jgi:hypothetical protein
MGLRELGDFLLIGLYWFGLYALAAWAVLLTAFVFFALREWIRKPDFFDVERQEWFL